MKRYILLRRLEADIAKINEEIDARIIRGLSYKALSRQHKILIAELRSLRRTPSLIDRFASYASVFML